MEKLQQGKIVFLFLNPTSNLKNKLMSCDQTKIYKDCQIVKIVTRKFLKMEFENFGVKRKKQDNRQ